MTRRPAIQLVGRSIRATLATVFATLFLGCATVPSITETPPALSLVDPLEPFNRAIFSFNDVVDRGFLRPVANVYQRALPLGLRASVGNFFDNLRGPTTIINDLLQGNFTQAVRDFDRFTINTTLGIAGLYDVATPLGRPYHQEDYGQTLAIWGLSSGPYLVLPLVGPSTPRDAFGLLPEFFYSDPLASNASTHQQVFRYTLRAIDIRASLLKTDRLLQLQIDPYLFVREAYRQQRQAEIYDGRPPESVEMLDLEKALFND